MVYQSIIHYYYCILARPVALKRLLRLVGNDIHPSIQLEYECLSIHGDNKLPLLDVKLCVTTLEGKGTQLMHEYYQKKVASRSVVHAK